MTETNEMNITELLDKLTALGESEMQLFRMLLERPFGVILTAETDIIIARLLERDGLVRIEDESKVIIPSDIREDYRDNWSDELTLKWRKRNWMYKCIETGRYLYGVMTWDVLKELFALRYPHADMEEVRELFDTTPVFCQWFTEREGKLVLNGFEKDDYYKFLEQQIQGDVPFYIPHREEVEELYERGCLISRENHTKLRDFIEETFNTDKDTAGFKVHELYDAVNNRVRLNDAVEAFASGGEGDPEGKYRFPSDEAQVKFIELYIEMNHECRIRDNRGHDYYEMIGIMAGKNREASGKNAPAKRIRIGRNEPCPCGSGRKYKNCCGKR